MVSQQFSYPTLSFLRAGLDARCISVDIIPETQRIIYDAATATLHFWGCEDSLGCVVQVHVRGPLILDDLFIISNNMSELLIAAKETFGPARDKVTLNESNSNYGIGRRAT